MSVFSFHLSRKWFVPVLGLVCCTGGIGASAQEGALKPEDIPAADYVSRAKALVQKLYPELDPGQRAHFTDERRMSRTGVINMFDFTLGNECSEEANPNGNTHPRRKAPFHAQFTFSVLKDKELIFFRVTPPATGPSSSFAQSVRANPKWSEVQITQAAKGAGAIYGPENKNQFLTAIPIEELKAYIGESKVESAQFYAHRPEGPSGSVDIVDYPICIWNVEVTSHLASGAEHHYLLLFDAFGGKLFNISWTGH